MIQALLALLLIAFMTGCGENSLSPGNTEDRFAILLVPTDTFYAGEQAWIKVKNAGTDISILRLFIHSVEVKIDRFSDDCIYFEVPRGASTGSIRLYQHDTLKANGTANLNVFPHHIDDFRCTVLDCNPLVGYPEELIQLRIQDFPLRRREFDLFLGETKLEVLTWQPDLIVTKVPQNASDGDLVVTTFDSVIFRKHFDVVSLGEKFLASGKLSKVSFKCSNLLGTSIRRKEGSLNDTTFKDHLNEFEAVVNTAVTLQNDTLFANTETIEGFVTRAVRFSLSVSEANEISGTIELSIYLRNQWGLYALYVTVMNVKEMRWKRQNNRYLFDLRGIEINEFLKSFECTNSDVETHTTFQYREPGPQAVFSLEFQG